MKKKFWLVMVMALAALLCGACLCGCGLFGGNKPNDDNDKPDDGDDNRLVVVENIEYVLNDDGAGYHARSMYNNRATSAHIVAEVNGLPVTYINSWMFQEEEYVKSVTIDYGVKEIKNMAFRRNDTLETLVIPSSVTTIESGAFEDCSGIKNLTAPATALSKIPLKNLETLVVDGGEEIISTNIYDAKKLKSVEIKDGITAIGEWAFRNCVALESISIPDSVKTIGKEAFTVCENLRYTEKDGAKYLGNTANPYLVLASVDDKSITSFDFEDGTKILYGAFNGCKYLESVEIPSDTTCIGNRTFSGCKSLTELKIPSAVAAVGEYAFLSCDAIVAYCEVAEKPNGWDVNWNNRTDVRNSSYFCPVVWNCETNKADGDGYVYEWVDNLRYKFKDGEAIVATHPISLRSGDDEDFEGHITIPASVLYNDEEYPVTEIGRLAFLECENITVVFIENGVKQIAYRAFEGCNSLTRVNIPDSIERIVDKAFYNCNSLISVEIPLSVAEIGQYAFYNTNGLTIYCRASAKPDGWESDWYQSVYVYNRTSVIWNCGENDKDRDGYVYAVVNGVRYQLKNGTATVIGQPRNIITASILSTVTHNSQSYSVTTIDTGAFDGCDKLTSVSIPYSVTKIGSGIFSGCNGLANISVDQTNEKYLSAGNCLISKTDGTLLAGCKTSVIPSDGSVLAIGGSAFEGFDITAITIPNSVTYIGANAFSNCSGLTSIVIPDSVTEIGEYAFYRCDSLTSVKLSASLTSIGRLAFGYCTRLTSIRLPVTITEFGQGIFSYSKDLLDIYYEGTKAQWEAVEKAYLWDNDTGSYTIHCTDGDISKA